ncbi:DnaD domain protein [Bacillus mesophilus]|uniref:DnaD domain protein n=1 Tax=Bacillus mesophilus TaxID=1808955 RepID=A0A6M0Q7U7_9BACI|nr:DnaD domain protein [Bacillus mesophilus]
MVRTDFWVDPIVSEEMSPEDRYFMLYLLTNPLTTQVGIYKVTKKQIAFDTGYSIESVAALMNRFIHHHKVIRYNPETRELAIKHWGKYNTIHKGGKPFMDCIVSELKEVEDLSLIAYVTEGVTKEDIRAIYLSFCNSEKAEEVVAADESLTNQHSTGTQIETELPIKDNLEVDSFIEDDTKEIITFWDENGFGLSNVNGKQQLLSWLENSKFKNPKGIILKAMTIACSNNTRRLNYVVGILKNWENSSLLTVEEIDSYNEAMQSNTKVRGRLEDFLGDRATPKHFILDLTAGEDL